MIYLIIIFCIHTDIDCGPLGHPENGRVSLSGTTYNSVATYSCDSGYGLIGNNTRTCLGTGNWSGRKPTCMSKLGSHLLHSQANILGSRTSPLLLTLQ